MSSGLLIGRETELEVLTEAIEAATGGRPSAFVLSGEAGIGKTRLLREVKERARLQGAEMLLGGCIPLTEGALPYAPVVTALRQGVARLLDVPSMDLPAESLTELARLLPELRPRASEQPAATDQTRLFGSVLDLIRLLSTSAPLVFTIEDVHWSDASTRDLITYLLNMTESERVLFVCTLRTGELEPSHAANSWLRTLAASRMAETVELRPLSEEETSRQMREIAGKELPEAVITEIYQRSQGNPFFVEELIQASGLEDERLPPSLRDLFMQRIAGLSEEMNEVLKTASVAGTRIPHEFLVAVTRLDEGRLTRIAQNLVDRHLLVHGGGEYAFRHALLREAVYRRLLPGEKKALHRAFAHALEEGRAEEGPDTLSARLARHWDEAGEPERALPHALAAAKTAAQTYASSEARLHYEHALALWDQVSEPELVSGARRVDLVEQAAKAAHRAGDPEGSIAHWQNAIELLDPATDPGRAAQQRSSLAYVLGATLMDTAASTPLGLEARDLVMDLPPTSEKAEVLCRTAESLILMGSLEEGLSMARLGMEIATEIDDPLQLCNAHAALGLAYQTAGDPETSIDHHLFAIEIERQQRNTSLLGKSLANLSDALFRANRPDEAVACALDAVEELGRMGDQSHYGLLTCNAGEFLIAFGRFAEAEQIIGPLEEAPVAIDRSFSTSLLAEIDVQCGRFEQAKKRVRAARRLLTNMNQPQFMDPLDETDIHLALWERRYEDASALVQQAWESPKDERGRARLCALGLRVEADRAARARATRSTTTEKEAVQLGRAMEERCPGESPMLEIKALRLTVAAESGRLRDASDPALWKVAAEAWRDISYAVREAYSLYRLGESLLALGERLPAQEALSQATVLAHGAGTVPLALEIEGLARRGRLKLNLLSPREEAKVAPDGAVETFGLTRREVEVLTHLSQGLTNRQIAETLYISPKTASIHVSNILAKLGVSSRMEAARRAYEAGLLEVPGGQDRADP